MWALVEKASEGHGRLTISSDGICGTGVGNCLGPVSYAMPSSYEAFIALAAAHEE